MIDEIFTIGGYGHTETSFFHQLRLAKVDVLVDIRQRRGMRGGKYAFLNSTALQHSIANSGMDYIHLRQLAPTSDIREAQHQIDKTKSTTKSSRVELSDEFKVRYRNNILEKLSPREILDELSSYQRPCFFCVEALHAACHRSLVSEWIGTLTGKKIINLGTN